MKKTFFSLIVLMLAFAISFPAKAVCPVCTVAVGAGVGLSRWLGIDDMATGVWVGGLTISLILWTIDWMNKKSINFKGKKIIVWLVYLSLIIVPLYSTGIMGHELNKIFGIDKLLLGIIIGMAGFIVGTVWYENLKKKNGGHAYFSYQKVVMAIAPLVILSLLFYFLTK